MRYAASLPSMTPDQCGGKLPSAFRPVFALACTLLVFIATHAAAETPADLDGYCAKTYGAGATGGFDRRDNGPLCTERTNQGLGLLHHKVDPSDVCRTQHGMSRHRQEGPQILCLADDKTPAPNRKVDLAEYCRTNYGPSAIVSRRLTDNQPLCTVKGGGLSQTHHAIDLDALCGSPVSPAAAEGETLDCGAAARQASRKGNGRGGEGGGPEAGGEPRPGNGRPPDAPRRAPPEIPILSLADLAKVDLSDCGFRRDNERAEKSAGGRGGWGWKYGGIDTPCSQLDTGLKVDLGVYCSSIQTGVTFHWVDGGRPVCYDDGELAYYDLEYACIDAYPGGFEAFYASGLMGPIVKFSGRSLECFYVDIHGGPPSEPDELVEAET